ncbi:MAG: acetate--CoA ligase family protein [Alphaproteobacteria bacterium]|nr:acetate--CoA ligase family protein [Alphaproteobacteria bacterium]
MSVARGIYRHGDLRRLLHPQSVAIVGASQRPGAFGERVLANLAGKYGGRVYLVNARYEMIGENKCYPSLSALPEVPDCVMICVAREQVEPVVEECVAVGAGGAIVFASGYAEVEKPGRAEQQARLSAIARNARMPLIGPNCIGVNNYTLQARVTFMPPDDVPVPGPGAIGIISQSGAIGFGLEQAWRRGIPISHVLTNGNACDVDAADYVSYLADDPSCSAIALVFEGMAEPTRLIEAAEIARAAGKPVIACKVAVGEHGAKAAMSHTGSLAGSQAAYRAAFERAGIVMVDNLEALMETARFFVKAPPPTAKGVAVLVSSGGAGIVAADNAEKHAIPLPQPNEAAREVLVASIAEFGSPRNPCDVTAQVMNDPDVLPRCANAMIADPAYGAMLIPMVYSTPQTHVRLPMYAEVGAQAGKPIVMVWMSDWIEGPGSMEVEQNMGLCLFRSMDRAFAAMAAWHKRAEMLAEGPRVAVRRVSGEAKSAAAALIAAVSGSVLTEREAKTALAHYGIPVVQERLVQSAAEAAEVAVAMGLPAVLKVESPDLPHKTEAGVIRLNLKSAEEVRAAYDAVMANARKVSPPPRINGVLVQPMVPQGTEIMLGARVDPLFGPMVVVGLGGILVELLKDTTVGLAPVTQNEARKMLTGLKGAAALRGFRNSEPVDIEALADLIGRVSEFIADHRDTVAEIDINPLICAGSRILAVDALIYRSN